LAADVGADRAAEIYRQLVRATCARLPVQKPDRASRVIVHFDPAHKRGEIEQWLRPLLPDDTTFVEQCAGDLGARLTRAFAHAFQAGFEKVAVIGTDCVELT